MSSSTNFLICLVGLPASGKSTFASALKNHLETRFSAKNALIVDIDEIREQLTGVDFKPDKEKEVRQKSLDSIFKLLKDGNIVISDDLNYYSSMRHDLKAIADGLGLQFFTIHIATPINKCIEWNEMRRNKIPSELIRSIEDKFDAFDRYGWDAPLEIFDLSNNIDLGEKIRHVIDKIAIKLEESKSPAIKHQNSFSHKSKRKELLDKTTRRIVSELLQKPDYQPFREKILTLRKLFVRRGANESQSAAEIGSIFKAFLNSNLGLKN